MLASVLTGIPYSFTAHARDIYSDDVDFELLREKLERARFAVTVSNYNREYLAAHVGEEAAARLHVVYNGVDLDKFAPDPAVRREEGLILGVGRLVQKKGFAVLVEACRLMRDRGRRFRCEIVGGGELRAPLDAQVRAARLDGVVTLVGERSQEDLPALYRRASVLAMPAVIAADGNRDALPTVLLEAAACGLPAIASRLTGIAEIVHHGHTGLLVESGDAEGLSGALELLLDDPGRRLSMGTAARARMEERFDLKVNVQRLYTLLTAEVPDAPRLPVL
jgi:glycosyltransferase involved in cell wall biosynthesis